MQARASWQDVVAADLEPDHVELAGYLLGSPGEGGPAISIPRQFVHPMGTSDLLDAQPGTKPGEQACFHCQQISLEFPKAGFKQGKLFWRQPFQVAQE